MVINFKLSEYKLTEDYKRICEMAMPRKDAIDQLTDSEEQRIENLIQIFILRGQTINHWCNELYACCHENPRMNIKKKYFNFEELFDILFSSWTKNIVKSSFDSYFLDICDKEGLEELPEFDFEKLYKFLYDYHYWLADKLSKDLCVTNKEVKNEINELLK